MAPRHLVVMFAKAPVPGKVKTRLQPHFTPEQSASLHASFLLDLSERLLVGEPRWEGWLSLAGSGDHQVVSQIRQLGATIAPQAGGTLGNKMATAIEEGLAAGFETVSIIGSDAPTLPSALIHEAIEKLDGEASASFVPSFDGGFALICASEPLPALRKDIPWSVDETLVSTLSALREDNILSALTGFWYDVDEAKDVAFLARHLLGALNERAARVAPRTEQWLVAQGFDHLGRRSPPT